MSVRTQLAEQLVPVLPDEWVVEKTFRNLDGISQMTVQVGSTTYTPDPMAPLAQREITIVAWLIAPYLDPDQAEDPLEDALETLLDVLDRLSWLVWQTAERSTYPTGYPAYKITASSPSSRPE